MVIWDLNPIVSGFAYRIGDDDNNPNTMVQSEQWFDSLLLSGQWVLLFLVCHSSLDPGCSYVGIQ